MFNLIRKKIALRETSFVFVVLAILFGYFAMATDTEAVYTPYYPRDGWEILRQEIVKQNLSSEPDCSFPNTKLEYSVLDAETLGPIDTTDVKVGLLVRNKNTGAEVVRTNLVESAVTPSVCFYSPTQFATVEIVVGDNSIYENFGGGGYSPSPSSYDMGKYSRGAVYLERKNSSKDIEPLYPVTQIVNEYPTLRTRTNEVSNLGNSNKIIQSFFGWARFGTNWSRAFLKDGNGVGIRTYKPSGNLAEGINHWWHLQVGDGKLSQTISSLDSFDKSCGSGKYPVRLRLLDFDTNQLIDMKDITATIEVLNPDNGNVLQKVNWISGEAESQKICMTVPDTVNGYGDAISASIKFGNDSLYANPGDAMLSAGEVATDSSGKNFFRGNYYLKKRVATNSLVGLFTIEAEPIIFNTYKHVYTMKNIPASFLTRPIRFIIDTISPESSIQAAVGTVTGAKVSVDIENVVRDTNSGLARTAIFLKEANQGTFKRIALADFVVGSGLAGGPKGTRTVNVPLTVDAGKNYEYYAETTDAAGNVTKTQTQSIITPGAGLSVDLTADPMIVNSGGSSELEWKVTGIDSTTNCTAVSAPDTSWNGTNPSALGGRTTVSNLTAVTDFSILCIKTSTNETVEDSVQVAIINSSGDKPDIAVDKILIRPGDVVTVTWDPGTNQTGCVLSDNLMGNANQVGSYKTNPLNETVYRIDCPNGFDEATVKIVPINEET